MPFQCLYNVNIQKSKNNDYRLYYIMSVYIVQYLYKLLFSFHLN